MRPYLEKTFTEIGLVEWFMVKGLSSSPSTTHTHTQKIKSSLSKPFSFSWNEIPEYMGFLLESTFKCMPVIPAYLWSRRIMNSRPAWAM
jgi:hypothetical protein